MVRGLEIDFTRQTQQLVQGARGRSGFYQGMDQVLFEPPNVAGWPGGAAWLSSSTFFARANFIDELLFPRGRPLALPAITATGGEGIVDEVTARLVDGNVSVAARDAMAAHVATIGDRAEAVATAAYLVAASPEFQLI
jgi:hypothetical protein